MSCIGRLCILWFIISLLTMFSFPRYLYDNPGFDSFFFQIEYYSVQFLLIAISVTTLVGIIYLTTNQFLDSIQLWTGLLPAVAMSNFCQPNQVGIRRRIKHSKLRCVYPSKQINKLLLLCCDNSKNVNESLTESTDFLSQKFPLSDETPFDTEKQQVGKAVLDGQNSGTFSAPIDIQAACRTVLFQPHLKKLFKFDVAEICLFDPGTKLLTTLLRVPEDESPEKIECVYRIGEGYTGWIAEYKTSLCIEDTSFYSDVLPKAGIDHFPYRSYLGVPLNVGEKFLGTLELASTLPNVFSQQDIVVLEAIANQAAIIIENARLFGSTHQQLQVRFGELAGIQRVSSEINSTLDLDKILSTVLEEVRQVTQADFVQVYFYNNHTDDLIAYGREGWHKPDQSADNDTVQSGAERTRIVGEVLRTGQSILVKNSVEDKRVAASAHSEGSQVVVPIHYAGEPIGVINLESHQLNFFKDSQLRYLEALANHAAVAIGNAEAYQQQKLERQQANRRADQLARLSEISNAFRTNRPLPDVLEDIAFAVAESVGYDVVFISLVRNEPPMIYHEVGLGIPVADLEALRQPEQAAALADLNEILVDEFQLGSAYFFPASRMAVWQEILSVPYVEKERSFSRPLDQVEPPILFDPSAKEEPWQSGDLLIVPLKGINDNLIGLLMVVHPLTGQRPDLSHVQTLETFANYAASAIENAQLFKREQERRQLADTLRGVAEMISSSLKFEELLQLVLQELKKVVEYDKSTVELLEDRSLIIIGGGGWEAYSRQIVGLSFSMEGNNPSRRVIETQEPGIIFDAKQEYPAIFSAPPYDRIRSWLGVPLTYGTNVLGLMAISSHQIGFFTKEDADIVLAFANQVAVALQNAQLFDEAQQKVKQLRTLADVARSLNQTLELDQVLNLVLDAVFDLVGQSNGSIWLIDNETNTVKIANTHNIPDFLAKEFNQSNTSITSEPFASIIKSNEVLVVEDKKDKNSSPYFGFPFPQNVTYVPLTTEDGVIGVLAIETVIHNRAMLELVRALADLAAVAIDSARLLEDTRTQAADMQRLYKLGVEISGVLEVRQVMRRVVSNVLTLMDSQVGVLLFWDEHFNQYVVEGQATTDELLHKLGLANARFLQSKTSREDPAVLWAELMNQLSENKQPFVSNLGIQQTIWSKSPAETLQLKSISQTELNAMKLGLRAVLGVPILVQNQITGAIFTASTMPTVFHDRDVQILSFVASQAVVAIRNAHLVQRLNLLTEGLEQRVAQRTQELARTLQDLTEERDRVEVLYELARQLSSSFDLDTLLSNALNLLNRAIGIAQGTILLLDPKSTYLIFRAALGRDKPLPPEGLQTRYKLGHGLAGKVMETRQPRLISDLANDPDWIPRNPSLERRAAIAVPLSTGDEVLGALLLFHPEPHYFTEEHLQLVSAAGTQIATAVTNAELYRLITQQANRLKVMLREQAAEAAKNEAILKGIADGVLVLDIHQIIVLVNPKAAEILNIDAALLEYQSLQSILDYPESPEDARLVRLLYDNLIRYLAKIQDGEPSVEFRVSAGRKVVVVTLAPVKLYEHELPSTVAVIRDISKDAEIDRLKNELISSVSHELRTPMTSIKGYTDLLLSGNPKIGELNPTQHRFVKVVQSNANRLTALVNDILEISRIETGRIKLFFEPLDVTEVVRDVVTSFEGQLVQKSMYLSLDLPDDLPKIYADKARLTQILVNLIGNAWQYTPEAGNITIHAKALDEFVQIDVEDNGIGVVEEDLKYLFDRFFRSERTEVQVIDGTGLGLSITKSFVEMLGGRIWVKSKLDVGTTFSFTVPLCTNACGDA